MYPPILRIHIKKDQRRTYLMMLMLFLLFIKALLWLPIDLHRLVDAIQMGIHIDLSMQFKWVSTTYAFIKKQTKEYTGCNLKTTELLDCTCGYWGMFSD